MLARYLAIIEPPGQPTSDAIGSLARGAVLGAGLKQALSLDGLQVFIDPEMHIVNLPGGKGLVLGQLFKGKTAPDRIVDAGQLHDIVGSEWPASRFFAACWGAYLVLARDTRSGRIRILRDPSGTVPCYYMQVQGAMVIMSGPDILLQCGAACPDIDWTAVAEHLLADQLRRPATCLRGITELLGGLCLTVDSNGGHEISTCWSPWDFASRERQIADPDIATRQLRDVVLGCVGAWGRQYRHILLGLSGGLDSSIVAACLAHASANFSCVTFTTADRRGDERHYARLVADAFGISLYAEPRRIEGIDISLSHAGHLPRPIARSFAQESDRIYCEIGERIGADAFFSGGGGDNVFAYMKSAAPIADRFLSEGVSRGAFDTACHMALLTNVSLWRAMALAVRRAYLRKRAYRWPCNTRYLNPGALEHVHVPAHPWLEPPPGALPGKAVHVAWLLAIQNHLEGNRRERHHPSLSPLMSQPIIETCLQIPSWLWCDGGRDRAIARMAFAGHLPAQILDRRSKGSPDSFVVEIFETHRPVIRDLLCGGLLAAQKLVLPDLIAADLAQLRPADHMLMSRIMALVDVEAWLRCWRARRQAVPHSAVQNGNSEAALPHGSPFL